MFTAVLSFLKTLRIRWPGEKLYVIADNYSPHKHPPGPGLGRGQRR